MVRLRPHHGLCIHHFVGKGYSPAFVKRMEQVIRSLKENPDQRICLTLGADILCKACPHRRGRGCESGPKPQDFDARCLLLCGLEPGEKIGWKELSQRIEEGILAVGRLAEVCAGCQWLGICLP